MKRTQKILLVLGGILAAGLVAAFVLRSQIQDWWFEFNKTDVPAAVSFDEARITDEITSAEGGSASGGETLNENEVTENNANSNVNKDVNVNNNNSNEAPEKISIPESINLAIPFTSQAPHANWDLPYQEACEEASVLMAARFLQGRSIADANDADTAILELVNYNTDTLDQPIDTTAVETARLIEEFYELKTELIYDFSWDDVKRALAQGYPVIIPAAGRQLGNPNFTSPGPLYHMLVIKGYTPNVIITNDPGTRRGADYQYSYDKLYNAVHDWNDGNVGAGAKVMIIVKP